MNHAFSSFGKRLLALVMLAAAAPAGCKAGSCDDDVVDRAVAFVKAHQSCTVDADCVVIGDHCETLPGGWCGQLSMNRAGQDSAEWAAINSELEECAPESCTVCGGLLVAGCHEGSCTPP